MRQEQAKFKTTTSTSTSTRTSGKKRGVDLRLQTNLKSEPDSKRILRSADISKIKPFQYKNVRTQALLNGLGKDEMGTISEKEIERILQSADLPCTQSELYVRDKFIDEPPAFSTRSKTAPCERSIKFLYKLSAALMTLLDNKNNDSDAITKDGPQQARLRVVTLLAEKLQTSVIGRKIIAIQGLSEDIEKLMKKIAQPIFDKIDESTFKEIGKQLANIGDQLYEKWQECSTEHIIAQNAQLLRNIGDQIEHDFQNDRAEMRLAHEVAINELADQLCDLVVNAYQKVRKTIDYAICVATTANGIVEGSLTR